MTACVLAGAAVGMLCNRPLVRTRGWAVATPLSGTVLALALGASPANAAVSGLVSASASGDPVVPWVPLLSATACAVAARRP